MPTVGKKLKIKLPADQCRAARIKPGDKVQTFLYDGQITIVKKIKGAAKGILKNIITDKLLCDEESRQSAVEERSNIKRESK